MFAFSTVGDVNLALPGHLYGRVWQYQRLGWQYPMHHHRELEINLAIRGTGSYLLGNQRYLMKPRSLVFLFPGQDHILLEESTDFVMWEAIFAPELLQWACRTPQTAVLLEANPPGHFCKTLGVQEAERLIALLQTLNQRTEETDYFNAGLVFLLQSAWSAYLSAGQVAPGRSLHPAVEKAIRLISEEKESLSLETIAARAGISPSRMRFLFRSEMGMSLLAFRNRQRIERFLSLYRRDSGSNLMNAALEAGFGSYAQFHRVFKAVMGRSPSRFTD